MSASNEGHLLPEGTTPRWCVPAICLALAAITFAVFGQTAGFGFVNLDDPVYVYENPIVTSGLSLKGMAWVFTHGDCELYHPLTMLSLMVDYQLHGPQAGGYHLTNVLLHAASAILLFLVLRQMTGSLWRSAFVAAVFAIHPLRVESVAWVAERKEVLGGFFFMLTLAAYGRYVRNPNSLGRYLMVAAAFALALLSKPTVVTLPFVLLLLDYWPLGRFEQLGPAHAPGFFGIPKRLILEKIPLLALAAVACEMTVLAAGEVIASKHALSLLSRAGNASVSYAVYLRQMIWPAGLAVYYPQTENGNPAWTVAFSLFLLALLTAVALVFGRKRRWLLTGWLWYLGMLTPMIGLVPAGAFAHADRMTYLPQIGLYLLLTWTAADLTAGWRHRRAALGASAAGILLALIVYARTQAGYWQNSQTLWTRALACTTNNDMAHYFLGADFLQKGRLDDAIAQFQDTVQLHPDSAAPHLNLGLALLQKGSLDDAIAHFQEALQIRPDYAPAHYNLGLALFQKGSPAGAISQYQQALQIDPAGAEVQNKLAWLLATCADASLRDGPKAAELARQANERTGGANPLILRTLAAALAEAGRFSDATRTAQQAVALARSAGRQDLADQLNGELKRYEAGLPLHQ